MLINIGCICLKYEDFVNIHISCENNNFFVNCTHIMNGQSINQPIYAAKDKNDAFRFVDMIAEKFNSHIRYTNEKITAPSLQLWAVQSENSERVSRETQYPSGSNASSSEGRSTPHSTVEDIGSNVMDSGTE